MVYLSSNLKFLVIFYYYFVLKCDTHLSGIAQFFGRPKSPLRVFPSENQTLVYSRQVHIHCTNHIALPHPILFTPHLILDTPHPVWQDSRYATTHLTLVTTNSLTRGILSYSRKAALLVSYCFVQINGLTLPLTSSRLASHSALIYYSVMVIPALVQVYGWLSH